MLINQGNAQRIVEEMGSIIQRPINMMDARGYIIASTDQSRIGQFHAGAHKVIEGNLPELVVEGEGSYQGAKQGINLPIYFGKEIIGVIGITGPVDQVIHFGRIIKKMTEILVMDSYRKEQGQLEDNARNYFIEEWVFGNSREDDHAFEVRGRLLGLDVKKPRIAAVMNINAGDDTLQEIQLQRVRDKIIGDMKKQIDDDKDNVVISIGSKYIFLMHAKSPAQVKEKLQGIKKRLEEVYQVKVATGIGSLHAEHSDVSQSYHEAEKALQVSLSSPRREIKIYEEINIELLIEEISYKAKKEFVDKVFAGCTREEMEGWMEILEVFFKYNGSINKAADELYIHKNTLQYRINKLIRQTGLDPRATKDGLLLYLAMLMIRSGDV